MMLEKPKKKGKATVFTHMLTIGKKLSETPDEKISYYDHVRLISQYQSFDVMAAWNDSWSSDDPTIYLGHWNDGCIGDE